MNLTKSKSEIFIEQEDPLGKSEINQIGLDEAEFNKSEIKLIGENNLNSKKKLGNNSNNTEAIKTFCRIRPIDAKNEIFKVKDNSEDKTLLVNCDPLLLKKLNTVPTFTFSKVFDENSTQLEVFEQTCQNLVEDLIKKRKPGLIFTYGMTNAGKTFTVIGSQSSPGILPQSLKYLYDKAENNEGEFSVFCNFVEIYNEEVYDLLANSNDPKNKFYKKKITIKENNKKLFFLHDVTYQKISNLEDFNNSLTKGISKKVHAATNLNQNSSRSHTIFKIILKPSNIEEEEVSLSIVDLAGSERANRTEAQGKELQEACKINQSLSVLGKCMEALRCNSIYTNKKLVPFRESKLTMLFQEYFQGDQNVIMVTNINPRREDFEETIRALNYSCIAKEIKPIKSKIVVNPIRKQVKIVNPSNNIDNNLKESEINAVLDKENFNVETGRFHKSSSSLKINSVNVSEVNLLKSELEKLKEEFLKFKCDNNVSLQNKSYCVNNNDNLYSTHNMDQIVSNPNSYNPLMQMMNLIPSLMTNDNSHQQSLYNPSYFPFMWNPYAFNKQFSNQNCLNNLNTITNNNSIPSEKLDLELVPPNMNSFNLVFINSKFNDLHMGPKKKVNKYNRKNKKDSLSSIEEIRTANVEIKEIADTVQVKEEEFELVEIIKNNSDEKEGMRKNVEETAKDIHDEIQENKIEISENFEVETSLIVNDFRKEENIIEQPQEQPKTQKKKKVNKKNKVKSEKKIENKSENKNKNKKKKQLKKEEKNKEKDENTSKQNIESEYTIDEKSS